MLAINILITGIENKSIAQGMLYPYPYVVPAAPSSLRCHTFCLKKGTEGCRGESSD